MKMEKVIVAALQEANRVSNQEKRHCSGYSPRIFLIFFASRALHCQGHQGRAMSLYGARISKILLLFLNPYTTGACRENTSVNFMALLVPQTSDCWLCSDQHTSGSDVNDQVFLSPISLLESRNLSLTGAPLSISNSLIIIPGVIGNIAFTSSREQYSYMTNTDPNCKQT